MVSTDLKKGASKVWQSFVYKKAGKSAFLFNF